MKARCGICHEALIVDDDIQDGQDLQCPYCNGIFTYRKPTRIEVPTGARNPRGGETPTPQSEDVPDLPHYKRNPKLRIIRPTNMPAGRGPETNPMVERVDARAKAEDRRKRMLQLKKQVSSIFAILVIVGLGYACFKGYQIWKRGEEDKILSDVSGRIKDGIGFVKQEFAPEENAPPEDRTNTVESVVLEDEPHKNESELENDELAAVKSKFAGCRLSYWRMLPKGDRPGATVGTFYLLVAGKNAYEYYEIVSSTGNTLKMRPIGEKDASIVHGYDEYSKILMERGGIIWKDGAAYLITVSKKNKGFMAPLNVGETFDPAEKLLGKIYQEVKKMDTSDVRLEVLFSFDEADQPKKVATVRFGETVPYRAFETAAALVLKGIRRKPSTASPDELRRVLAVGSVAVKRM